MRRAVHHLKYGHFKALAAPLGQLLAQYLESQPVAADVLVPVPLHSRRLRERGYNQSALLAAEVGRRNGLPVVTDSLGEAAPHQGSGEDDWCRRTAAQSRRGVRLPECEAGREAGSTR